MAKYEAHDFYCMKCGRKGLPVHRKCGQFREPMHRKNLYCVFCREEVNHIEVRNQEEKEEFMEAFNNGEFTTESIYYVRSAGKW